MYIPKSFEVQDREKLVNFIKENSFGIMFAQLNGQPFATHLPFLLDENSGDNGILSGHMAKANPHWKEIHNQRILVVFQGPHAYISPTWYGEPNTVPTWNYVAVHVYGKMVLIQDKDSLKEIIRDSVQFYEPSSSIVDRLDEEFFDNLLNAVVGFRIEIDQIEGKWKLSQNHSEERQRRVTQALKKQEDPNSKQIANLMERHLENA
ncbi:FMN-binding negative transcriptional regulator [Effusibacillus consociatus]|uniref:FMN-binding negative transcriptional regulator n=1 Tax=Effusibacillus consociatus TaxID=1117041 RepID=A0ABV9Q573_9BACL